MASANTPFYVFPYREEEQVNNHRLLRPTLDVLVGSDQPTKALIDTGSRRCLFARGIGEAARVDFGLGAQKAWVAIGGKDRRIVLAYVPLTLALYPHLSWQAEVGFFLDEWPVSFGILGHEGFLDRFVVSFNYANTYFVVEEPADWEARAPLAAFEDIDTDDPDWWRPRQD